MTNKTNEDDNFYTCFIKTKDRISGGKSQINSKVQGMLLIYYVLTPISHKYDNSTILNTNN